MNRNTGDTESLIVEYGFIDDTPANVQFLNDNYKQLAEAVIEAIADYKGINYTSPFGVGQPSTYTVKKGDSLYSIANRFNTTVQELKSLNNLTSNNLQIGQVLKIPGTSETTPQQTTTYTVKKGDSLYSIANRFNTTVQELKSLNNLTSNNLQIGQILKIPSSGVTPGDTEVNEVITYIVKSGDTLEDIADRYNITTEEIINLNNLQSSILREGQSLLLPIDTIDEPPGDIIEPELPDQSQPQNQTTYTVKSGDTLYSIANRFETTVNDLKSLNNLTSNVLSIGQVLKIPNTKPIPQTEQPQTITYTVQSGDRIFMGNNEY